MSSPSFSVSFTLIIYFFVCLFSLVISGQNGWELPPGRAGRTYFWRSDAPLTRELAKFRQVVHATDLVLTHFDQVEQNIISNINTGQAPGPNDDIRPCNYKKSNFATGAFNRIGIRGWPLPEVTCVSDVFGTKLTQTHVPQRELPQYTVDDIYEALYDAGKVVKDNIDSITKKVIDNFTNPDIVWNCPYETPSQRCVVHPAGGFRIGDKWYLSQAITNEPKSANLRLFDRQTIAEYPRVDNGKLGNPKHMCLYVLPETGEIVENRSDTTTLIASRRGIAEPSLITRLNIDDNPAILRSLDDSDLFAQQAEDALSASNIAILVLPLGLNLVPVALLTDVSTITMLLYTLMSDILTVVPLGIKGAELIDIGTRRHRTVFVRITGASNGSRPISTAAEMHAAECRTHNNVLPTGITFLVLSIVFLVGGVVAEFVARYCRMRKQKVRLEEVKASLQLSYKGSSKPPSTASTGASPPHSLILSDIQTEEARSNSNLLDKRCLSNSYFISRS